MKEFFENCDQKIHLITSEKVLSSHDLSCYFLWFKKLDGRSNKKWTKEEGSTIRGLIEAIRGAGLEECASQLEDIFANDNSVSVDIPSVPGKENGATVYLTSGKGEINNKADSVMNVPKYTGEETNANDIADTAV